MALRSRVRTLGRRMNGAQPWLLLAGAALFCLGGLGDLLYHLLPPARSIALESLLGAAAMRAHLLTFIGMVVIVVAILYREVRHALRRRP